MKLLGEFMSRQYINDWSPSQWSQLTYDRQLWPWSNTMQSNICPPFPPSHRNTSKILVQGSIRL